MAVRANCALDQLTKDKSIDSNMCFLFCICQVVQYVLAALFVGIEIGFQEIRKEKQLQDHKHNEQLDQDHQPHLLPPTAHTPEPVQIKMPDPPENILFHICRL